MVRSIALLVLALTACSPDAAKVDAEIQKLVASYITSTDINASLSMLDSAPSVTSVTGEGRIVRGPAAIKDEANKQIARLPQLTVTVGAIEVSRLGTTHALAVAPFALGPRSTPQKPTTEGAATLLLARRDSGWKVIHEHFSYTKARPR